MPTLPLPNYSHNWTMITIAISLTLWICFLTSWETIIFSTKHFVPLPDHHTYYTKIQKDVFILNSVYLCDITDFSWLPLAFPFPRKCQILAQSGSDYPILGPNLVILTDLSQCASLTSARWSITAWVYSGNLATNRLGSNKVELCIINYIDHKYKEHCIFPFIIHWIIWDKYQMKVLKKNISFHNNWY